jgi:hypothetical protein
LFSAPTNPQRIPVNTPPVSRGLRSCICQRLIRLVTKAMSDRLLAHYKWLIMGLQGSRFYNRQHLNQALDDRSPEEFEKLADEF